MIETVLGMTDLQIRLFTAIGQILVAAAVGGIAWRQWRTAQQQAETARKKLRLDLFEERIKTFDRIQELLDRTLHNDPEAVASNELFDLAGPSGRIRWLFGPTVQKKFNGVLEALNESSKARRNAAEQATSDSHQRELNAKEQSANEELQSALRGVSDIFADSLTLLE